MACVARRPDSKGRGASGPISMATTPQPEVGRAGLAAFFRELRGDLASGTHALIDPNSTTDPCAFLCNLGASQPEAAEAGEALAPVKWDSTSYDVPRVEVRPGGGAVVFVGVPSRLGGAYFRVPVELQPLVEGTPTG